MIRKYIFIVGILLLCGLFFSCSDDKFDSLGGNEIERIPGLPVEFEVFVKDLSGTRGLEESKKVFNSGELIHIRGEFFLKDTPEPIYQYGIIQYKELGQWNALNAAFEMYWPETTESANFTAYYLYGSTGALSSVTPMTPILLSEFQYGKDPLYGVNEGLEYGHVIRFEMEHLLTHLSLTQINPGVADEMYFTIPVEDEHYDTFNNAFVLEYDSNNNEIMGKFTQVKSETYKDDNGNPLVYISAPAEIYLEADEEIKAKYKFFLEPKDYQKFHLLYPRTREETSTYITYNGDLTAQTENDEGLLQNHYYEFSIEKSLGSVIKEDPEEEWDDENQPVVIVDVPEFVKSISRGESYSQIDENGNEVQLLEAYGEGTKLLRNVDFKYEFYDVFDDGNGGVIIPNLGLVFDGNFHYIYHIACPLFHNNNGIITNVGFVDAKTGSDYPLVSNGRYETTYGTTLDTSVNGMICRTNNGTVSNIRMNDANMVVKILTSGYTDDQSATEAHSAGILFGSNRGSASNISFGGHLELTVENFVDDTIMPNVAIGGIAGQNLGTISGISSINDEDFAVPSYNIFNKCHGTTGVYVVGGVIGNHTGVLSNVLMSSVLVDSSESSGVSSIVGGIIGAISQSTSSPARLDGCILRGEAKAGASASMININSVSYIGGVAGSMHIQGNVTDSSASVGVTGPSLNTYDEKVTYGAGGAFGRIEQTQGNTQIGSINTLACFGSTLTGIDGNVGNFAGITPAGFDEEYYQDPKKNINVKQYTNKPFIGVCQ